ncbi:MAG TPA: SurA N-terminal domain-containing protein [Candidatus Paceibacterota bacterium]
MGEETTNQEGGAAKRGGLSFAKLIIFIVIVAAIIVVGYFVMNGGIGGQGAAVAMVNGSKITRSEYDVRYARLENTVTAQGQSATSTEIQLAIKEQVLNDLISETLVLQAAEKEGIKADSVAVDAAFTQSKAGFPDATAFEAELKKQGFTESTFKETIERNNIIQQYLKAHIDISSITASEAEVKDLYEQVSAGDDTVPPLSEVRAQVENQIISQKQQVLITNHINELKAAGTVETLI